jgi:G patch domain/KOW motif-containing protein
MGDNAITPIKILVNGYFIFLEYSFGGECNYPYSFLTDFLELLSTSLPNTMKNIIFPGPLRAITSRHTPQGIMNGTKLSFSLKTKKKSTTSPNTAASDSFEPLQVVATNRNGDHRNNDQLPNEPLIIPVQIDGRKSLQEQARLRRLTEQTKSNNTTTNNNNNNKTQEETSMEDQAAINALTNEAGQSSQGKESSLKLVIEGSENTFQRFGVGSSSTTGPVQEPDPDTQQFQNDLNRFAPELSVDSAIYKQVPIADFGAAMLRGMGWVGQVDTSDVDFNLPRPARLGLGATPKLLDAPKTHGKMRRQDQVKRDEQLKQQQQEYEKQRQQQLKLDKQRTIQEGSIVWVNTNKRAIIRKWQGVPGLNMCLLQLEEEEQQDPFKVKKGDVQLIDREELHERPFLEPKYTADKKVEFLGMDTKERKSDRDREHGEPPHSNDNHRTHDEHSRRDRKDETDDRQDRKRHRDEESRKDRKRHKDDKERGSSSRQPTTATATSTTTTMSWLVPHIRVRVMSSKLGKQYYKEKGIVVDVTRNGTATLTMGNGQVIQAPERYLETALPRVGGNACILTGKHRLAKGKLLERDSRKNRGAVQVFEDMNIVTASLDDLAEWCGPLDDDLME